MNLRRKPRDEAEVSTESLNDIMFFLLLFFLIISTLAKVNTVKLNLPKSAKQQEAVKRPVTVAVKQDKTYYIEGRQVPFEQLEEALLDAVSGIDQPTVILNVAKELSVQDLVDVMQVGVRANVKMVLGTEKKAS